MRLELPVLTKCCYCMPLRYGLLGWGYIKLAITTYCLTMLAIDWWHLYISEAGPLLFIIMLILCVATVIVVLDFIMTVTFVVGCHQKKNKLINIFYFYSHILIVLTILLGVFDVFFLSDVWTTHRLVEALIFVIIIGVQSYILLLIRSHIIKPNNVNQRSPTNHTSSDPECTMNAEAPVRQDEKAVLV